MSFDALEWIDAWNRHDIEAIMGHYADPPHHTSPLIVERLGRADGTIRTTSELRDYFQRGLASSPPLHFELLGAYPGVSSVAVHYRNHRGRTVIEVMHFNPAGKITASVVH